MKVIDVEDLYNTDRDVNCPNGGFKSTRLLLESDGMGYTVTSTLVHKGPPQRWHYKNHKETCYCIEGYGILVDVATGSRHVIRPGMVYVLDKHDEHTFEAIRDTILICVFNPPLKGREVHKKDGSYGV